MRRNPLFIFKNTASVGIYDVPLKSTIQIVDVDGAGTPAFLQLIAKVGLGPESTITNLLSYPEDYIDLFTVGEVYSELEKISENGKTGWRILHRDPENHGDIGLGAFDLGYSSSVSIKKGALGDYSMTTGYDTSAWGVNATAVGLQTIAGFDNQFILGRYNKNSAFNIFEVGIGLNENQRRNAFEITKEGVVIAPSMEVNEITDIKTLITKEYFETNVGLNAGQLLKITEDSGTTPQTGWRIAGRDPETHEAIGEMAVDLSKSTMVGNSNGASGSNSFAAGLNVIMRNQSGSVFGQFNEPQPDTIFEIGNGDGVAGNTHANAFEIYKDGRVRAPSLTPLLINTDRSLVTKEYLTTVATVTNIIVDTVINTSNIGSPSYGVSVPGPYDENSIEVFNNGVLLKPTRDYIITTVATGIQITFNGTHYTLHIDDWLRIKIPVVNY